jgi:hypothetical protein
MADMAALIGPPFRAERSNGGVVDLYAILAGTFRGKLVLLVTAFESLG